MGSKKITIGYIYYMGIHMGLARGPLDEITTITVGDKTAWSGSVTETKSFRINNPNLFGGKKKEGGIDGTMAVLMGAPDQQRHSGLARMLGGLVPAFRGVATCFFDGEVCALSAYPKPWAFRVRRALKGWHGGIAWYADKAVIALDGGKIRAMNPAHILYQLYTDPSFGRGLPAARLDDASFRAAADILYTEGFGLCLAWARKDSIAAFAQTVIDHIGAVVYVARDTGLLTLRLIRDDYDVDTLPEFTPDTGLLGIDEDESVAVSEMTNEIIVKYVSPTDGKERAVRVKNNAAIVSSGAVSSESREYPGIPTAALALRVAARDLKMATAGVKRLSLRLDRRGALIHPGDVFAIASPSQDIGRLVLRAGRCEYGEGTDGTIKIDCAQDVFGLPQTSYVGIEPPAYIPPDMTPYPCATARLVEAPYRFLAQIDTRFEALDVYSGFLTALAAAPSALSYGFELWTKTGANAYTQGSDDNGTFCAVAQLSAAIDCKAQTLTLIAPDDKTGLLIDFEEGGAALIDEEWLRIDAFARDDSDPDNPVITLTVGRGCCDSVPAPHAVGAVLWFVEDGGGADLREYVSGQKVDAKLLTVTPGGTLDINDAPASSLTFAGRAGRPYPPGNFKINGQAYPETITGALTVSWAHRDRVTQADLLIDTAQGNIGPEADTTYRLQIWGDDDVKQLDDATLTGTSYTWEHEGGGQGDMALLHFDGDATDEAGTIWTQSGTIDYSQAGEFGNCATVSGIVNSRLVAPATAFGMQDFTVEAFVNLPAQPLVSGNSYFPLWLCAPGNSWNSMVCGIFLSRADYPATPTFWLYNYNSGAPML
ncbi:MAG: phage tail protein, partial [Zoogloeaceae bacterium]|nr:phage tail protein [Zoogloeaceae bacterium]